MKSELHPKYGPVIFRDASNGKEWYGASTKLNGPKEVRDGVEYHVITLEISGYSHPFFTGEQGLVDTAGRVDKFKRRFGTNIQSRKKTASTAAPKA